MGKDVKQFVSELKPSAGKEARNKQREKPASKDTTVEKQSKGVCCIIYERNLKVLYFNPLAYFSMGLFHFRSINILELLVKSSPPMLASNSTRNLAFLGCTSFS